MKEQLTVPAVQDTPPVGQRPQKRARPGRAILILLALSLCLQLSSFSLFATGPAVVPSFTVSQLDGDALQNPTSLQFGPDDRLYVSQQNGLIYAYTIERRRRDEYVVVETEEIRQIYEMPNHNDDGFTAPEVEGRQVTGIYVTGTRQQPLLYVSSSDPRIGAGSTGSGDIGLDTNSGVISRLAWNGDNWRKIDLVRGLPRSEQNHSTNGLQLDTARNVLYVAQASNTNAGAPSGKFGYTSEYALAGAILEVDLEALDRLPNQVDAEGQTYKYNLPTLNDPGGLSSPWGGADGLNQALLVPDGPVQIYSPGYRNPYDIVFTATPGRAGRLYTVDNGANPDWGGYPAGEGPPSGTPPQATCTNDYVAGEPGFVNDKDGLHFIAKAGYYAGHPNPIRANPTGAGIYLHDDESGGQFLSSPVANWPPVPPAAANPIECDYLQPNAGPGTEDPNDALIAYDASTNGIAEYTASNFDGAMRGNLLMAAFDGDIFYAELNDAGTAVLNGIESIATGFGARPLDVTTQGDNDPFPGTIWVATYGWGKHHISIFEPADFGPCSGSDNYRIDEDEDGYSNGDELDNGTDPCSAASSPPDHDGTEIDGFLVSDLNDPDDDDDRRNDDLDPFALDPFNGRKTRVPLRYDLFNSDPGVGIGGLGFTGLMSNGSDYLVLLDPADQVVLGGAAGLLTIPQVATGTALADNNSQVDAYQFGVAVNEGCAPFTIKTRLLRPLFNGQVPTVEQLHGFYIGAGNQDDYLLFGVSGADGARVLKIVLEVQGQPKTQVFQPVDFLDGNPEHVDLLLTLDPAEATVQPAYQVQDQTPQQVGNVINLPVAWLQGNPSLAVGLLATTGKNAPSFAATWDFVDIYFTDANAGCTATTYLPLLSANR